jgi:competence protein ComEA
VDRPADLADPLLLPLGRSGDPAADDGPAAGSRRAERSAQWVEQLRQTVADRVPVGLRAGRRGVSVRAGLALLVLAVAALVVALTRLDSGDQGQLVPARAGGRATWSGRAAQPAASSVPAGSLGGPVGGSPVLSPSPSSVVVVDVAGQVRRPGLVRLPPGSRVWDAVTAAGGPTPAARLEGLNLARPLTDGEQVRVPGPNDPVAAAPAVAGDPASGGTPGTPGGPLLDLNAATSAQLETLPGVGPVLAGRILAWRTQHGRFSRVEELAEVTGIGEKLFAQLRPLVRV